MALFLAVRIFEQCLWYNKYSAILSKRGDGFENGTGRGSADHQPG